jgi:hypothetical protein
VPTTSDPTKAAIDAITFTDPQVQLCPFNAYRTVMEDRRLHRDPVSGWWEVLGHDDLMRIVQDPALFSSEHTLYGERTYLAGYAETSRMFAEEGYPTVPALINADEPARYRGTVAAGRPRPQAGAIHSRTDKPADRRLGRC